MQGSGPNVFKDDDILSLMVVPNTDFLGDGHWYRKADVMLKAIRDNDKTYKIENGFFK